jgi:hypothetical protein
VQLLNARIEEDGDIHLVIQDKYARKMIVEFPNTTCKGSKASDHKDEMKQARDDLAALCGLGNWNTRTTRGKPKGPDWSSGPRRYTRFILILVLSLVGRRAIQRVR